MWLASNPCHIFTFNFISLKAVLHALESQSIVSPVESCSFSTSSSSSSSYSIGVQTERWYKPATRNVATQVHLKVRDYGVQVNSKPDVIAQTQTPPIRYSNAATQATQTESSLTYGKYKFVFTHFLLIWNQ